MRFILMILGVLTVLAINSCGTKIEEYDFFDKIKKLQIDREEVCKNIKNKKNILKEIKEQKNTCENYNEENALNCFSCLEKLVCDDLLSYDKCTSCKNICNL